MPTPKQQYKQALDNVIRRYLALEDDTTRAMVTELNTLRDRIAGQVVGSDFAAWRQKELQASVQRLIDQYQVELESRLKQSLGQAGHLGGDSVVEPIVQAQLGYTFNSITPALLNTTMDFSAALIRQISDEMRGKIDIQLRLASLGQRSQVDVMRGITDILGTQARAGAWGLRKRPEVVQGIAARSEAIVRTELTRIFNMSAHTQQLETARAVPDLLKRWLASGRRNTRPSHLKAHARYSVSPIPVAQPYEVGASLLQYPGDPAGEAKEVINCLCSSVTIHPVIGVVGTPLDDRVKTEIRRREELKQQQKQQAKK